MYSPRMHLTNHHNKVFVTKIKAVVHMGGMAAPKVKTLFTHPKTLSIGIPWLYNYLTNELFIIARPQAEGFNSRCDWTDYPFPQTP